MSSDRIDTRRSEWFELVCTELHHEFASVHDGAPAQYIPELAEVDPELFAISACAVDGRSQGVGDQDHAFTIQSIAKLLLYGLALETHGREQVLERVGVAPTGDPFNAIQLDEARHRAPNPMVNSGAIAVTDLVAGSSVDTRIDTVLTYFERFLGRTPDIDERVCTSEQATGHRNRAIGHLLLNSGIVQERIDETLDVYFAQSSVLVTTTDLALIGATIANGGTHPVSGEQVVPAWVTRDLLTIALTCGMYDYAGEWAYTVGIPAKSGVGGGIMGMIPGVGGLATMSPRLDEHGNSVRGIKVFETLSARFDMHLFDGDRPWAKSSEVDEGAAR